MKKLIFALIFLTAVTISAQITMRINETLINALADTIAARGAIEQATGEDIRQKLAEARTALGQSDINTAVALLVEADAMAATLKLDGEYQQNDAQAIKNEIASPTGGEYQDGVIKVLP